MSDRKTVSESSDEPSFVLTDHLIVAVYLSALSLIYFPFAFHFARHLSFWYDELFTYYVAFLPDVRTIWRSLLAGMDVHPPLDYILRHYSMLLFGHSELGARIPSIAAFYGSFLCVFFYARAAHSTLAGVIASSMLLGSSASRYAVEARGYSLILFFASAALLLWRALSGERKAPLWMWVTLGMCLAGSVWTHYYGVLIIAAFAIAGLVYWAERGRFPTELFITLMAVITAIVPLVPFAAAARSYSSHFWSLPPSNPFAAMHDSIGRLGYAGVELLLLIALCTLLLSRAPSMPWSVPQWGAPFEMARSEIALLIALQFGPVMQWLLARTITNAYVWRYTIASIAAACVVGGLLLARLCAFNSTLALAVCLVCILYAPDALFSLRYLRVTRQQRLATVAALDNHLQSSTAALAAPHGNTYLVYYYYGSVRLKRNLVMFSDEDAAVRLGHTDSDQIALEHLASFVPIRLEPVGPFIASHPRIDLTIGRYDSETWIIPKLLESGYKVSLAPVRVQEVIYNCEYVNAQQ
jgi:hypothetical protein